MQKITTFLYNMNTETYGSFTKSQLSMQTKAQLSMQTKAQLSTQSKAQLSMQIEHLAISMGSTWRVES